MTPNLWFWILLVVAVLLAIALVTGLTVARRRRISLRRPEPQKGEIKPRGGGYQAGGGIALARG
ncbi:signal recognition particle-docking protein FtsY, partial [Amycolatopsis rhizosphaerae]